jgi:hypothetical protein
MRPETSDTSHIHHTQQVHNGMEVKPELVAQARRINNQARAANRQLQRSAFSNTAISATDANTRMRRNKPEGKLREEKSGEEGEEDEWAEPWQDPEAAAAAGHILLYLCFLTVFCASMLRSIFSPDPFYFNDAIKSQYLGVEMLAEHSPTFAKTFEDVTVVEEYYHWILGAFFHSTFSLMTFDGKDWDAEEENPGTILGHNRFLGGVRMSQIRALERDCTDQVPGAFFVLDKNKNEKFKCYGKWSYGWRGGNHKFMTSEEDKSDFGSFAHYDYSAEPVNWDAPVIPGTGVQFPYDGLRVSLRNGSYVREPLPLGQVQMERDLYMSSYTTGLFNTYPTGSHSLLLDPRERPEDAKRILKDVLHSSWIDLQTKVVLIEGTIYSANLDSICHFVIAAEMLDGGGVFPSTEFEVVRLWQHHTTEDLYADVLLTIAACFYLYYFFHELKELRRVGASEFFSTAFNCLQTMNIVFFGFSCLLKMAAVAFTPAAISLDGSDFNTLKSAVSFTLTTNAVESVNAFLNFFKLIMFLSYDPAFSVLTNTLHYAAKPVFDFAVIFFIVFTGFSCAFVLVFGTRIHAFRTLAQTMYTLSIGLLGDFDFRELQDAHGYMGPLLFMLFIGIAVFVVLNMLIAIIAEVFNK